MTTPSVPNSTKRAESPVEEIIEDVEHIFSPKPGGMIDSWHQAKAQREAAQREAENAAEKIEEKASFAVKVAQLMPSVTAINSINIAAGGYAQVLPMSPYRYKAVIISSATIVLAKDSSQALGGTGFSLPANTPITINSRAQLYASAVGAAVVGVLSEIYAPE
jgi:hypothetical protein